MVADDMLVIPLQWRREPPANIGAQAIDAPITRQSKVGGIVEHVYTKDPVGDGGCEQSPPLAHKYLN